MLKGFISTILSFVMLICATTISVIIIGRIVLSENTINEIVDTIAKEANQDSAFTDAILTLDRNNQLNEYFDNEELTAAYGRLYRDFVFYNLGIPDTQKPSIAEIKELVNKYCQEYENKTGNKVDMVAINGYFETFENEITKLKPENTELTKYFEILYSNKIICFIIATLVVCTLLIYLLKKDILKTIKSISTVSIINGVGIIALGFVLYYLIGNMSSTDSFLSKITQSISNIFYQVGGISLGLGLIVSIIIPILKKHLSKSSKIPVNQTI